MKDNKTKQALFEQAVQKASLNPNFIAHYINDHKALNCPRMNYLKLALCLVPKDLRGLQEVCEYAGVDLELTIKLLPSFMTIK